MKCLYMPSVRECENVTHLVRVASTSYSSSERTYQNSVWQTLYREDKRLYFLGFLVSNILEIRPHLPLYKLESRIFVYKRLRIAEVRGI